MPQELDRRIAEYHLSLVAKEGVENHQHPIGFEEIEMNLAQAAGVVIPRQQKGGLQMHEMQWTAIRGVTELYLGINSKVHLPKIPLTRAETTIELASSFQHRDYETDEVIDKRIPTFLRIGGYHVDSHRVLGTTHDLRPRQLTHITLGLSQDEAWAIRSRGGEKALVDLDHENDPYASAGIITRSGMVSGRDPRQTAGLLLRVEEDRVTVGNEPFEGEIDAQRAIIEAGFHTELSKDRLTIFKERGNPLFINFQRSI